MTAAQAQQHLVSTFVVAHVQHSSYLTISHSTIMISTLPEFNKPSIEQHSISTNVLQQSHIQQLFPSTISLSTITFLTPWIQQLLSLTQNFEAFFYLCFYRIELSILLHHLS